MKGGDLPDSLDAIDVLFDGMLFVLLNYQEQVLFYVITTRFPDEHPLCWWYNLAGKDFFEFRSSRIKTPNTHGTGCSLASSIAAELAKGSPMISAIKVINIRSLTNLSKKLITCCSPFII